MKQLGFLLLIAGFLCGAYATALHAQQTQWLLFAPAAIAAAIGVMLVKRQSRGEARSESVLSANRVELSESLDNIVAVLDEILSGTAGAATDLPRLIDERLRDDLRRFADARESLTHHFGLQTYANIMSEFAAGERYIPRVWSAAADGYHGEARDYLQRAKLQFSDAKAQLHSAG
jgi:hypothetical protein